MVKIEAEVKVEAGAESEVKFEVEVGVGQTFELRSDYCSIGQITNGPHRSGWSNRKETWSEENADGRWRKFSYDEIITRDKTNLDIFWLRDKSLTDLDNLPDPDVLANEIIENIEAGLESFREVMETLNGEVAE